MKDSINPDDLLVRAYDPKVVRRLAGFVVPYRRRALAAVPRSVLQGPPAS